MDAWDRSMLAMSPKELEIQETVTSIERLVEAGHVRSTTRVILEGAVMALRAEITPG